MLYRTLLDKATGEWRHSDCLCVDKEDNNQRHKTNPCLPVCGKSRKGVTRSLVSIGVLTISNLREPTRILNIRELATFAVVDEATLRDRGNLALPGFPGEKHPNCGLSAIAVWFWLAQRARRPVILVYDFDERHTPEGEGKSCAPQALSPVPLWRPSTALGLQCRDKCLTPEIA